jgi:hypothetical protein
MPHRATGSAFSDMLLDRTAKFLKATYPTISSSLWMIHELPIPQRKEIITICQLGVRGYKPNLDSMTLTIS